MYYCSSRKKCQEFTKTRHACRVKFPSKPFLKDTGGFELQYSTAQASTYTCINCMQYGRFPRKIHTKNSRVNFYKSFAPLTTVYPVQERNTSPTITIGHIDECHYVSTTALQSNASISMCNVLCLLSLQIHNVFAKNR